MNAEQGPLWGCDRECGLRADATMIAFSQWIGGEAA